MSLVDTNLMSYHINLLSPSAVVVLQGWVKSDNLSLRKGIKLSRVNMPDRPFPPLSKNTDMIKTISNTAILKT